MTRKEYNQRKAELTKQLATIRNILQRADESDGKCFCVESADRVRDIWNMYNDTESDIERKLSDLESDWETRNWTAADWQSWNLIAANVD